MQLKRVADEGMGVSLKTLLNDRILPDLDIKGLAVDSRKVGPGYLFAALSGARANGVSFIEDAIARGANAILVAKGMTLPPLDVLVIEDPNPRRAIAQMAARFYGGQPENLVAVTGTNGKSSVVELFRQMASHLGFKAASIGTLGVNVDGKAQSFGLTTPDPITFHETLAQLKTQGVTHAAFEASSHGLAQHRVDGVKLKAAAFTNLSRDHLDYHGTLEDYLYAKLRLVGEVLAPGAVAVLNADSAFSAEFEALAWARAIRVKTVGLRGRDITLLGRHSTTKGQDLHLRLVRKEYRVTLPLIGDFQASNALVAAGLMLALGADGDGVIDALAHLTPVRGRLEDVGTTRQGAQVVIDYAHTPDGLEVALNALRPHCRGRLHVVFGCGGDRDKGKRPLMGEIAARLADVAYVTDDNPRSEDAAQIRAEILIAAPNSKEIGDRQAAISAAIQNAGAGDIVLIAGKGHESGQIVGDTVLPFSDFHAVRAVMEGGAA